MPLSVPIFLYLFSTQQKMLEELTVDVGFRDATEDGMRSVVAVVADASGGGGAAAAGDVRARFRGCDTRLEKEEEILDEIEKVERGAETKAKENLLRLRFFSLSASRALAQPSYNNPSLSYLSLSLPSLCPDEFCLSVFRRGQEHQLFAPPCSCQSVAK
jgi:hypothetical protein